MSPESAPTVGVLPQGRRWAALQIVLFKVFYLGLLLLALPLVIRGQSRLVAIPLSRVSSH